MVKGSQENLMEFTVGQVTLRGMGWRFSVHRQETLLEFTVGQVTLHGTGGVDGLS